MNKPRIERIPIHGWLNLHKPLELSSAHAVGAVKRILKPQKIGHAGTLDPLASGVLPLALGDATKTVPFMMDAVKVYRFTITFGTRTATDDREGEVVATSDVRPNQAQIEAVLPRFIGNISQLPPIYSALKVDGERAYALARAGQDVQLKPREIRIDSLVLVAATPQTAELRVTCGKGTYVRSLARDIAHALGTEGHVSELIRERVGVFHLNDAISLDFIEDSVHNAPAPKAGFRPAWLKPVYSVLDDIPARELDAASVAKLRTGQSVIAVGAQQGDIAAMHNGELVALCRAEAGMLKPKRVFNN